MIRFKLQKKMREVLCHWATRLTLSVLHFPQTSISIHLSRSTSIPCKHSSLGLISMASTTLSILHRYKFRDQSTLNASERRSMDMMRVPMKMMKLTKTMKKMKAMKAMGAMKRRTHMDRRTDMKRRTDMRLYKFLSNTTAAVCRRWLGTRPIGSRALPTIRMLNAATISRSRRLRCTKSFNIHGSTTTDWRHSKDIGAFRWECGAYKGTGCSNIHGSTIIQWLPIETIHCLYSLSHN